MLDDVKSRYWDVVIIGAGLGGGIAARKLAEAGLHVLMIERGPKVARTAENAMDSPHEDPHARSLFGCWPTQVEARLDGNTSVEWGAQGVGPGGTSVFYAAALERPERHDFESTEALPHPTGGWPVGYDEFAPWFARAEALMEINGTADPLVKSGDPAHAPALATPRGMSSADKALSEAMQTQGLHPYRSHVAIRQLPGCTECIGHKCPRDCKRDGRSAGVEPALATGRAVLLDGAVITRLGGSGRRITHVTVQKGGQLHDIRGATFVLAAGGIGSPRLLLASASEEWPQGCANDSGLVGRGLMFHLSERIALWPPKTSGDTLDGPSKALSIRDFYADGSDRMGLFQSIGLPADYGNILHVLHQKYDQSPFRIFRPGREFMRFPAMAAARLLGEAKVFVGILEDLPDDANRVHFDPSRPDVIIYDYRMSQELLKRRQRYRRRIKRGLGNIRSLFLNIGPELNVAHPCGTLRFSDDPARGVLDRNGKAHGIDNLYGADSSFMPTSTGVNPGLTNVANSLRVAQNIIDRLSEEGQ